VLAARPDCRLALRYLAVEADPALRARQLAHLDMEPPAFVLGPSLSDDPDEAPEPVRGVGPLITSLAELPALEPAVVVAAGWLSALPSDQVEWRAGRWRQLRLAGADDGRLEEVSVPVDGEGAERFVPAPLEGARYCLHVQARAWLAQVRAERVAVIDRFVPTTEPVGDGQALAVDQLEAARPSLGRDAGTFSPLMLIAW
jgi:hypothetical protein